MEHLTEKMKKDIQRGLVLRYRTVMLLLLDMKIVNIYIYDDANSSSPSPQE